MVKNTIANLLVTVSAVRIDGKKLTKSVYDQFKKRSLFKSDYFENLQFKDYQKGFAIIARHNYQIKENFGDLHFLYWINGEVFVDHIHPNQNIVLNTLSEMKKCYSDHEYKLEAAQKIISGAEIEFLTWNNMVHGKDTYKYDIFCHSIFDDVDNNIESFESALKFRKYVTQDDFHRIINDKALTSVFVNHAKSLAQSMANDLPDEIIKEKSEFNSLQSKYEFVMEKIINAPSILIGV